MQTDILFFAEYPHKGVNEGMSQRILQVDEQFRNFKRVYVSAHIKRLRKYSQTINDITIIYLNPFLHLFTLLALINKSKLLYIHSVYNFINIVLVPFSNKKVVLDIHGLVPEEEAFRNVKIKSKIYNAFERVLFKRIDIAIAVSNSMIRFYKKKYPELPVKYILNRIGNDWTLSSLETFKTIGDKTTFLYSGGMQKWQNIPSILSSIEKLSNPSYHFIFLTHQVAELKEMISKYNLANHSILIESVGKNELKSYYDMAHYGFLLRDPHVLNEVSAPTKLIEYLSTGITPILLSTKIGDFTDLKMEYLDISKVDNNLSPSKSEQNIKIAITLQSERIKDLWSTIYSI